jgi:hypothetical protein
VPLEKIRRRASWSDTLLCSCARVVGAAQPDTASTYPQLSRFDPGILLAWSLIAQFGIYVDKGYGQFVEKLSDLIGLI